MPSSLDFMLKYIDFRLVPSLIELGKFDLYVEASEIPDSNGDRFGVTC